MESFPRFERKNIDAEEKIRSLKEPLFQLFIQLKERIAEVGFDGIVSDDTGARIPTLIFKEVYKKLTGEHPKILFVSTGQSYYPKTDDEKKLLNEYLKSGLGDAKHVAIVTQYIHSGDTVRRLVSQLENAGYDDVSVVALDALTRVSLGDEGITLYAAHSYSDAQHNMAERHMLVSDIAKMKSKYSPVPMRLDTAIKEGEITKSDIVYREEYNEFTKTSPSQFQNPQAVSQAFDENHNSVVALDDIPFTPEEKNSIQQNINYTRELASEVAGEIVAELYKNSVYVQKP